MRLWAIAYDGDLRDNMEVDTGRIQFYATRKDAIEASPYGQVSWHKGRGKVVRVTVAIEVGKGV